ncbi:hypothetical protein BKA56DRAFT_619054 [Ilyonectria sp. MPI-CAGE-AT-0026]|nr:hypothetical protein BKA56DRAFT_619054 [Ilyonectria sp. MPI-CAGE-AT-0026]
MIPSSATARATHCCATERRYDPSLQWRLNERKSVLELGNHTAQILAIVANRTVKDDADASPWKYKEVESSKTMEHSNAPKDFQQVDYLPREPAEEEFGTIDRCESRLRHFTKLALILSDQEHTRDVWAGEDKIEIDGRGNDQMVTEYCGQHSVKLPSPRFLADSPFSQSVAISTSPLIQKPAAESETICPVSDGASWDHWPRGILAL